MGKTAGVPVAVKVDTRLPPASKPIGVARIGDFPLAGEKSDFAPVGFLTNFGDRGPQKKQANNEKDLHRGLPVRKKSVTKRKPKSATLLPAIAHDAANLARCCLPLRSPDFKLLSDENDMADYQFNNRTIHHPFCKTCGIQSYAYGKGTGGKDMVMLNVRCLDGIDTEQFKVKKFDGASL